MRRPTALLAALLLILSAVAVPVAGTVVSDSPSAQEINAANEVTDTTIENEITKEVPGAEKSTETHPPDPPSDRLGWEDGLWYNETISVTPEDGLNDSELELVVARSMARVEVIRGIEFEETVPVKVISRSEYRERQDDSKNKSEPATANDLHQNVKWEAMFSIGENEDALTTSEETRTATVGGFYNFVSERIVIISENATTPQMDEITLSQELFHALQDQRLRVSFNRSTREGINAGNGIVEGDGNLVDRLYQQRCEDEWECVLPQSNGSNEGSDDGGSDINYGIYLTQFQPYSDGPKFVRQIRNEGGWEAVDDVYDNPPESTEQIIHTEKYPDDRPVNLTFEDTSNEEWYVPDLGNGSVDYARFGQAGLSAMFMRPVFASGGTEAPVVGPREFYNLTDEGMPSSFDPLNYGLDVTNGWGNDRLYPYVTNESAETNETGYVWKIEWDSESDATEFVEGYEQLLEHYGGQAVAGNESTYRIPDDREFGDAFYVGVNGTTVTLVNGPTVGDLTEIRAGAAPEETTTPDGGTTKADTATEDTGNGDGPGFGVLVALLAVIGSGLVAAERL
ncbi:MAG: Hvo_1808 family surface protein [Halapricum sp.]